jgi:hypothetical protein
MNTEIRRALRAERLAVGLCSLCGEVPHRPSMKSCAECAAEASKKGKTYRADNPVTVAGINRRHWVGLKLKVFTAYGGSACKCCGETEFAFLTLDHINDDGAIHRRFVGGSRSVYLWVKKHGFPPGFQVLCWNCNAAKSTLGKCPHEQRRTGLS